jgi:hypothetical protein
MPAKSKAQQKLFGFLVGHPAEAKRRGVSKKLAKKMASTPRKGLPEKLECMMGHKKKKK